MFSSLASSRQKMVFSKSIDMTEIVLPVEFLWSQTFLTHHFCYPLVNSLKSLAAFQCTEENAKLKSRFQFLSPRAEKVEHITEKMYFTSNLDCLCSHYTTSAPLQLLCEAEVY